MIFGYARVSTKGQAANGNSLDSQLEDLKKAGAEEIYTDTFTGTTMSRPEFEKLRMKLRRGDTLIITKLDRLARSVSQASGLITDLIDEGITINVLNLGVLSNDSINVLMRNILLSFAQLFLYIYLCQVFFMIVFSCRGQIRSTHSDKIRISTQSASRKTGIVYNPARSATTPMNGEIRTSPA